MTRPPRERRQALRILAYLTADKGWQSIPTIQAALKMPQGTIRREVPMLVRDLLLKRRPIGSNQYAYCATLRAHLLVDGLKGKRS